MKYSTAWRLILALSRFGGLRVPSEIFVLKWGDVDLNKGRFLIHSPKTEHHPDGASRVCPIFPELRPYFEEALLAASDGSGRVPASQHVVATHRTPCGNMATQFLRFIEKAKLTPWPKLWHNLRATRQTELENQFPTHVVCKWLGNSPRVAAQHYLRVTEDHFSLATGGAPGGANRGLVVQDRAGQNETEPDAETRSDRMKHRENSVSPMKTGASANTQKTPSSGPNRT